MSWSAALPSAVTTPTQRGRNGSGRLRSAPSVAEASPGFRRLARQSLEHLPALEQLERTVELWIATDLPFLDIGRYRRGGCRLAARSFRFRCRLLQLLPLGRLLGLGGLWHR